MDNPEGNPQLDIVAQRWPDVTLDEAAQVLNSLARPLRAREVIAHSGRPTAAGSLVRTDSGNVFIKRYAHSVRAADGILPYHRFVAHLAAHGIPTPPFLAFDAGKALDRWATAAGARARATADAVGKSGVPAAGVSVQGTTLTVGDAVYEVCAQASGEDRYVNALSWDPPATLGEAERLGEFVARIALASAGFDQPRSLRPDPFQNRFGLFASEDLDAALDQWLDDRLVVKDWIGRHHRDVHRDINLHRPFVERLAGRYQRLAPQWTHGDPHISNFLWVNDGDAGIGGRVHAGGAHASGTNAGGAHAGYRPVSVFDFGLADRNTALFDLTELIERHAIQYVAIANGDDAACRPDIAAALVRGWNRVRPIGDLERELLPDLLVVCQAEAALNWIAYYVNGTGREEDALWCYDTSCVGHAAWFTRAEGRRFLDALRGTLDAL